MNQTIVTHDLAALAVDINTKVAETEGHIVAAATKAIEIGEKLMAAKAQLQHGEWTDWLAANVRLAPRTAQAYMRMAEKVKALPLEEARRVAGLPVRQALKAITTDAVGPDRGVYRASARGDRERLYKGLSDGARALHVAARDVAGGGIKQAKIKSLREKLAATIEALDEMTGGVA